MKISKQRKTPFLMLLLAPLLGAIPGAAAPGQEPPKGSLPPLPQQASTTARSPNPALEQLRRLEGTWECRGKIYGWPFPAARDTVGQYRFEFELAGFWVNARYDERPSAAGPAPFSTEGHWGWEDLRRRFVVGAVDNLGGFTHSWTTGREGDTMVWGGGFYGYGPMLPLRETFALKDGTLTHTFEIDKEGWRKTNEEVCTRADRPPSR